ncbi:unnamed protein product [Adineta steineri]|uniref:Copine C-terminal domain-containing protein n=1 Tax=Adineta steineri TaxID=433720 RepID=A0A818WJ14_9BILA|nr:unnamed protein product [Adineta steineri]CAF3726593.1 unnamed protein product [Adineta steineri]
MLWPLVYYLVAFFAFVLLYEYYRRNILKQKARLDLLASLDGMEFNSLPTSKKKPFEKIKQEIASNFYFERIRIIFGIDLSASNEWQGKKTYGGQSLHKVQNKAFNPYQKAIGQLGPIFEEVFTSKIEYSCFGFGDEQTKDYSFFPIVGSGDEFSTHQLILDAYLEQTKNVALSGPTEFTPIVKKLISYGIYCPRDFTMLVILTDELKLSSDNKSFVEAIRMLANLPNVCLLVIGVGDGPWEGLAREEHSLREAVFQKLNKKQMEKELIQSKLCYDNFHFVNFNAFVSKQDKMETENYFARAVVRKLPTQLKQAFLNDPHRPKA